MMQSRKEAMSRLEEGLSKKVYEAIKNDITNVTLKWHESFYVTLKTTLGTRYIETFTSTFEGQPIDSYVQYKHDTDVKKWDPSFRPNAWLPSSAFSYTCTSCEGKGLQACAACRAKGEQVCVVCFGTGKLNCSYCHGTGYFKGKKNDALCNRCTDGTMKCKSCAGKGAVKCSVCDGKKHILCNVCHGKRRLYQRLWLNQKESLIENNFVILSPEIQRLLDSKVLNHSDAKFFSREKEVASEGTLVHSEVILAAKKLYGPAYNQRVLIEKCLNDSEKHALDERILRQNILFRVGRIALITYKYKNEPRWVLYDSSSNRYHFSKFPEEEYQKQKKVFWERFNFWWLWVGILIGFIISFFFNKFILGS